MTLFLGAENGDAVLVDMVPISSMRCVACREPKTESGQWANA